MRLNASITEDRVKHHEDTPNWCPLWAALVTLCLCDCQCLRDWLLSVTTSRLDGVTASRSGHLLDTLRKWTHLTGYTRIYKFITPRRSSFWLLTHASAPACLHWHILCREIPDWQLSQRTICNIILGNIVLSSNSSCAITLIFWLILERKIWIHVSHSAVGKILSLVFFYKDGFDIKYPQRLICHKTKKPNKT